MEIKLKFNETKILLTIASCKEECQALEWWDWADVVIYIGTVRRILKGFVNDSKN